MSAIPHTAGGASTLPRLISVEEAAVLLAVSDTTVRNWIKNGAIPYIELPPTGDRKRYRIPLHGLLSSLRGNYDLSGDLEYLAQVFPDDKADREKPDHIESRAKARGGRPTEVDANRRELFDRAQARSQ